MDCKMVEALIGKELADEDVKAFLDKIGIKYPKKDTIGASASDWSFWLVGKKAGVELLFDIDILNRKYKVNQAGRKGIFKPVLTAARFTENTQFTFPHQISHSSKLEYLKEKLGEPVLNENIYPAFIWNTMLDADREIELFVEYRIDKEAVWNIWARIKEFRELFRLYYTQYGETIESALKLDYVYDEQETSASKRVSAIYSKAARAELIKAYLFFIIWAIDNAYLYMGEGLKSDIEKIRMTKILKKRII
jgi:hypothetical protein